MNFEAAPDELADDFTVDHDEPADERWLISYADMMTLLFGLFVLLYAMQDQFDVIQQSAQQKFSKHKLAGAPTQTAANALDSLKSENKSLRTKIQTMGYALEAEKARTLEAKATIKMISSKPALVTPEQSISIRALEQERDFLRAQLTAAQTAAPAAVPRFEAPPPSPSGLDGNDGIRAARKKDPFHLLFTLNDGRRIERTVTTGLGQNGIQLDDPLPIPARQRFTVIITRDGKSVEAGVRSISDIESHLSNRVKYTSFPNGDRGQLDEWLAPD